MLGTQGLGGRTTSDFGTQRDFLKLYPKLHIISEFREFISAKHGDPAADKIVRCPSSGCRGDLFSAPTPGTIEYSTNRFLWETYVLAGFLKSQGFKLCFGTKSFVPG